MSKALSFRARALDATKPMAIFRTDEIPDLPDYAAINRAVPQMPTGMEKEEETEHHLQRALSAQQVYGTAEALVIPIPEIEEDEMRYEATYRNPTGDFKPPRQYIHVQAWGMDQEIPDYDMDSEDECWLGEQTKKMEVTPLKFENMMDRLEKASGQTVVTLHEAKALLKEDDDLTIAVYDYWLNKRLKLQHPLICTVKTEKRDGSTSNNPYVAFRRRSEKMQTRKNRKNDEASYEKMLKLRRDLNRVLTIFEMIKRREKSKKELLKLTIEIVGQRYQMQDWTGESLAKALAERHTRPTWVPLQTASSREWGRRDDTGPVRKKREYKKKKHKTPNHITTPAPSMSLAQYQDVVQPDGDGYSSDEDMVSPPPSPEPEVDDDPDGAYAFRRKTGCTYLSPLQERLGDWPWSGNGRGNQHNNQHYRYSLASLSNPQHCVGFVRRRMGRGGRVQLDRGYTDWDSDLMKLDLTSPEGTCSRPSSPVEGNQHSDSSNLRQLLEHIRRTRLRTFRPQSPVEEQLKSQSLSPSATPNPTSCFSVETFQCHQEQLMQLRRDQEEQLLKQETDLDSSFNLSSSFGSQSTSRFMLDSAKAQFAVSAVCNSANLIQSAVTTTSASTNVTTAAPTGVMANGPIQVKSNSGFSTSPAATVLQLNYPISSAVSQPQTIVTIPASLPQSLTSSLLTKTGQVPLATIVKTSTPNHTHAPIATKVTRVMTPTTTPTVLKLATTNNGKNDSIVKENHEGVNNIVKDKVVAMEVT